MADRCSICGFYSKSLADVFAKDDHPGTAADQFTDAYIVNVRLRWEHFSHAHLATYEHVEGTLSDKDD